jgi:hypothetical protein
LPVEFFGAIVSTKIAGNNVKLAKSNGEFKFGYAGEEGELILPFNEEITKHYAAFASHTGEGDSSGTETDVDWFNHIQSCSISYSM